MLTLDLEVRRQQPDVRDSYVACVPVIKLYHNRVQVLFIARSTCNGVCQWGGGGRRTTGVLSRVLLPPYYTYKQTHALASLHTYPEGKTSLYISSQKYPIDSCLSTSSSVDLYLVFSPRGPYMAVLSRCTGMDTSQNAGTGFWVLFLLGLL